VDAEAVGMEEDLGEPIARRRLAGPPGVSRQHAGDPLTRARVLTITDRCWCCRSKVRAVVGVLVEMSAVQRFVAFAEIADAFASAADPSALAARGIGPLRHRDSPGDPGRLHLQRVPGVRRAHWPPRSRRHARRAPAQRGHLRPARLRPRPRTQARDPDRGHRTTARAVATPPAWRALPSADRTDSGALRGHVGKSCLVAGSAARRSLARPCVAWRI
jgi:hypothetical protein